MNCRRDLAFRLAAATFALALFNSTAVSVKAQAPAVPAAKAAAPADDESPSTPPPLPPGMTGSTMNDPRVGLKAGLYDAGEAAFGLEHVAFLKKAAAFHLPATRPEDPVVQQTLDTLGVNKAKLAKPMQLVIAQLAFANSDFAFQGTHLFQGNFYGVNFYDISNPAKISLLTSLVCPGGQGDVSVYKNLLFMSVEMPNGRLDCGTQGFPPMPPPEPGHEKDRRVPAASPERFRGVRIFDISDIRNPKQVAAVQTCRGSHTHTLVVDPNDRDDVYLYVSGTSFVRPAAELAGCSDEAPDKDPNTSLFRIDVIKVPVAAPEQAKVVSSPRVFMDARSGALNGLNNGGSHGKGAEKPTDTNQCHDITAYSALGLAAGACSGNGILLDIKDPVHPKRVDAVNDPNYSYWHSASFSNDGTKVVFTDEWGGGLQPRCRATDPNKWGADAIFNLKDDRLSLASYYKMPAAQTETENCVAHNGSLVPIPGRDIEVQAWYQGGISVMDFTDATHPYEIAYFDRGPIDAKTAVLGGEWSAYWYNGYIYGSEIARGLDVFRLVPSKFLTQNEIDAANLVQFNELNVQNQQKITWPSQLVVARAYLDQLGRSQGLPSKRIADLNKAIARAQASHLGKKDLAKLHGMAASVETQASAAKNTADSNRLHALAHILQSPTA
jgi:hypothetical protein